MSSSGLIAHMKNIKNSWKMFSTIWQIYHVPQSLHSGIWPFQNLLVIGDSWQGFSCYGEQSLTLLESLVESHGKLDTEEWLLAWCQQDVMTMRGRTPNKSVLWGTCVSYYSQSWIVEIDTCFLHVSWKNRASNLRKDFAKRLEARFGKSSAYEVDAVDQECHIIRSTYHICLSYHIVLWFLGFRIDITDIMFWRRTGRSWRKIPPMPREKSSRLRGNGRCLCPVLGVMAPSRQVFDASMRKT